MTASSVGGMSEYLADGGTLSAAICHLQALKRFLELLAIGAVYSRAGVIKGWENVRHHRERA